MMNDSLRQPHRAKLKTSHIQCVLRVGSNQLSRTAADIHDQQFLAGGDSEPFVGRKIRELSFGLAAYDFEREPGALFNACQKLRAVSSIAQGGGCSAHDFFGAESPCFCGKFSDSVEGLGGGPWIKMPVCINPAPE